MRPFVFVTLTVLVLAGVPLVQADTPLTPVCQRMPTRETDLVCSLATESAFGIISDQLAAGPPTPPPQEDLSHPDAVCAEAHEESTRRGTTGLYGTCSQQTRLGTRAHIRPTQITLSCTSAPARCTYLPTYHVELGGAVAPGEWIVRGYAHLRMASPFGGLGWVVPDSEREISCSSPASPVAQGSCEAQVDGPQVTAGNTNTYFWEGSWTLFWVDATGAEHRMSTGGHRCYIAQFYAGGVC